MELVEGETLSERIARGALPIADVLRIGVQIADALDRAHRAGVVHRDLKPGNVMLTKSGAKLMDFGLARATGIMALGGLGSGTDAALGESPTLATPLTSPQAQSSQGVRALRSAASTVAPHQMRRPGGAAR